MATNWWSPWREAGPVEILEVDLAPDPARDEAARKWLHSDERTRADRFAARSGYRQYVRCRAALRAELCRRGRHSNEHLQFAYAEHGKPHALVRRCRTRTSFSVSHSGGHGLVAFAPQGRLGVDLEVRKPGRDFDGVSARVYGARERAVVRLSGMPAFYRLWTMKEALIKAIGAGFTLNPASFEVPSPMIDGATSGEFRFPRSPEVRWRLESLDEPRFAAAVAWEVLA